MVDGRKLYMTIVRGSAVYTVMSRTFCMRS